MKTVQFLESRRFSREEVCCIFNLAPNLFGAKNELRFFSAAKKSTALELYVYDIIGADWYGDGVTAKNVQQAIKDAGDFDSITLHINSPGGDSFEGIAIHNIIRQQKVPVTVIVEGLAASAAFTIAMSGDTIKIGEAGMMMLHNAWMIAIGNAAQLRKSADLLDKHDGTLQEMYSKRSGQSIDDVKSLCDAETWLTADEAIERGFADEKLETTPEKDKEAKARAAAFDLSGVCAKVPDALKAKKPKDDKANDQGCKCSCEQCVANDCENCSNQDCTDANCVHAEESDQAKSHELERLQFELA